MKVYVVNTAEYCDTLCGVFTTEEKAKKAIMVMKVQDDVDNIFTIEEWYNEFIIEEIILDKMYGVAI